MNEYHIQYLLISWVSWEMDLPGDQIRLVRRNVFISSSRIRCKAWAVMGFNFPPSMFQRGASSLMSSDSSQLFRSRNVQQMFSWVRLHLQFIHLPLFPFHYNLLQSPEPWGSSERLCSENGQRDSKWPSVQNIVATLKNDSKKHLNLQVLARGTLVLCVAVAGWTSHRGGEHFTHGRCLEGNWWADIARAANHISQTLPVDCMARLSEPKNDVNV